MSRGNSEERREGGEGAFIETHTPGEEIPFKCCINLYEPRSSGARAGRKVNSVCVLYGFITGI